MHRTVLAPARCHIGLGAKKGYAPPRAAACFCKFTAPARLLHIPGQGASVLLHDIPQEVGNDPHATRLC